MPRITSYDPAYRFASRDAIPLVLSVPPTPPVIAALLVFPATARPSRLAAVKGSTVISLLQEDYAVPIYPGTPHLHVTDSRLNHTLKFCSVC